MLEVIMDGSEIRITDGDKAIPKGKWLKTVQNTLGKDRDYEGTQLLKELTSRITAQQEK